MESTHFLKLLGELAHAALIFLNDFFRGYDPVVRESIHLLGGCSGGNILVLYLHTWRDMVN